MRETGHEETRMHAPHTYHEDTIRDIFGEVLDLPSNRISVDASFFDLGGQLTLATQLATRIGNAFHVEMPPRTIFAEETVERLAQLVEELTKRPPQGRPLGLRPKGQGFPLFCIHPSSGFGRPYRVLLRHLATDMPVYALEARGILEGDTLPATLGDMCADYINQIQAIHAVGPYHLLGWSFGAIPAHAIATEMQARGLEVASLILIDGFPFNGEPWVEELVSSHRAYWGKEILNYREVKAAPEELQATIIDRLCAIKRNNIHLQAYKNPSVFTGDALLVNCASTDSKRSNPFPWDRYVSGTLLEVSVPFGHNVLMTPEAAAAHGPKIANYLTRTRPVNLHRSSVHGNQR